MDSLSWRGMSCTFFSIISKKSSILRSPLFRLNSHWAADLCDGPGLSPPGDAGRHWHGYPGPGPGPGHLPRAGVAVVSLTHLAASESENKNVNILHFSPKRLATGQKCLIKRGQMIFPPVNVTEKTPLMWCCCWWRWGDIGKGSPSQGWLGTGLLVSFSVHWGHSGILRRLTVTSVTGRPLK